MHDCCSARAEKLTKTKALVPKSVLNHGMQRPLVLNENMLGTSESETHLGITRTNDCKNKATISSRIQSARRAAYSLMGAGMHGLNGINPRSSKKLWDIYVMPVLLHGLETLILNKTETQELESYYRKCLRQIQHLPDATATPGVYLLIGALPVEAHLHKKILTLLVNMMRRKDSVEREVVQRQLAMKSNKSCSWVIMAKGLLQVYNLPSAFLLLKDTPTKPQWRALVKEQVHQHWQAKLTEEASCMSTLKYINLSSCGPEHCHPVWNCQNTNSIAISKANIQAKLLVQRYPLMGGLSRRRGTSMICPLCAREDESLQHFLLICPVYQHHREAMRKKVSELLMTESESVANELSQSSPDRITSIILDPSHVSGLSDAGMQSLEHIMRDYCFHLHHQRSVLLQGESPYVLANRKSHLKTVKS